MPRIATPMLLLLIATAAVAQASGDLTARYGYPDVERFMVRPGITLMASYAEDRTACEMVIEPKHPIQQSDNKEQSMARDTVTQILEELVPRSERGILLGHTIENMGAAELQVAEYQNVTISRHFVRYLPANQDEKSATVVRKGGPCRPAVASQEFVPAIELSASDLHARYGDPEVERFVVRPGITLMVEYGADQSACQMVIEAPQPLVQRQEPQKKMVPEAVDSIVDELVPQNVRGRKVDDLLQIMGCGQFHVDFYENVKISRSTDHCLPLKAERDGRVAIVFKRQTCSK